MADFRGDQAAGLRRLFGCPRVHIVTFAAGSIGVGKSVTVANLAAALAAQGREVLVLDENADDNIAACFGVVACGDLQEVIDRERSLAEVIVSLAPRINLLPAVRAVRQLARLNASQQRILLDCLSDIGRPADVVLVDASPDHPLGFSPLGLAAHETVVVVEPNGAAITEAYALIKKVSLGYSRRHFRLLVNKARASAEAKAIHDNMAQVARSRGLARLDYAGCVPIDEHLRHASRLCQPVAGLFPDSPAARAYQAVATDLLGWPTADGDVGGLEHFMQQLLHLSQHIDPTAIYA